MLLYKHEVRTMHGLPRPAKSHHGRKRQTGGKRTYKGRAATPLRSCPIT
nr:MAG TPA: hypothetical protein [Caudoviricetes sp.]